MGTVSATVLLTALEHMEISIQYTIYLNTVNYTALEVRLF